MQHGNPPTPSPQQLANRLPPVQEFAAFPPASGASGAACPPGCGASGVVPSWLTPITPLPVIILSRISHIS